jgi:hypothetical protein
MLFAQQQRNRIMPYTKIESGATPSDCTTPLPGDFDSERFPILTTHWFGLEPQDVREVYWNLARLGHHFPAESNLILPKGGQE